MKNRSGSYKKILLSPHELGEKFEYLKTNIEAIKNLSLSDQDTTTLYILLYLRIKHPTNWLQIKAQKCSAFAGKPLIDLIPKSFDLNPWERQKLNNICGHDLFAKFTLKSIPASINRTMVNWYLGDWNIIRLEHIPTSKELLKMQVGNARCITTIVDRDQIDKLIFGVRDPLSFVLHDIMHADQFFNQPESIAGQLGFYQCVYSLYKKPELKRLLKVDDQFKKEFEYVASDMNAYVIHLFKCFKSAVLRTDKGDLFFKNVLNWWNMSADEISASLNLNTPNFAASEEECLKLFFESKRSFSNV
jgi:hypothetical protein